MVRARMVVAAEFAAQGPSRKSLLRASWAAGMLSGGYRGSRWEPSTIPALMPHSILLRDKGPWPLEPVRYEPAVEGVGKGSARLFMEMGDYLPAKQLKLLYGLPGEGTLDGRQTWKPRHPGSPE